jgi:hypothetical protein
MKGQKEMQGIKEIAQVVQSIMKISFHTLELCQRRHLFASDVERFAVWCR